MFSGGAWGLAVLVAMLTRVDCCSVQTDTGQSEHYFGVQYGSGPARRRVPREFVEVAGRSVVSKHFGVPLNCPLLLSRLFLPRESQLQSHPVDVSDGTAPHYPHDVLETAIHKPGDKRGFRGSSRHRKRKAIYSNVSGDLTASHMAKMTEPYSRD